ncbi:hypothetical protein JCM10213_000250 [Rhodosporidiobolus nylandii]
MAKRDRTAASETPTPVAPPSKVSDDDRAAKKQRKLERRQRREEQQGAGGDAAEGTQKVQKDATGAQDGPQEDSTAREAREKAERKAARKAEKKEKKRAAEATDGEGAMEGGKAKGGEDEREKKRAKKEKKREDKGKAREVQPVEEPADAAPSAPAGASKKSKSSEKDKKAASTTTGRVDPELAGLLDDLSSFHAQGQQPQPAQVAKRRDIPVVEAGSTSTSTSAAVAARREIPIDPALTLPSASSSRATAAATAFGPTDPSALRHAPSAASSSHDPIAALTAHALLKAKEQHEREQRERLSAAEVARESAIAQEAEKKEKKKEKDKGRKRDSKERKEKKEEKGKKLAAALAGQVAKEGGDQLASSPVVPAPAGEKKEKGKGKKKAAKEEAKDEGKKAAGLSATGDFYEQLVTKWIPVKELKAMAEEQGANYKQGKFSAAEDATIKRALDAYREQKNLTHAELVHMMTSKRDSGVSGAAAQHAGHLANDAWEAVARALGDRSLLAIYNHVKRLYAADAGGKSGAWTAAEDDLLRAAHKDLGNQWEEIAARIPGRSGSACRDRWTKQLVGDAPVDEGGAKKGRWDKAEEEELRKLHKELGAKWSAISKRMGGRRTPTQCRTKWNDFILRRDTAPQGDAAPAAPVASTSTAASASASKDNAAAPEAEAWRWKPEHASTLVHAVAALSVSHESEIDYKRLKDPVLAPQGTKNLRDRLRHLLTGAREKIAKNKGVQKDSVSFTDALAALLAQHPVPGTSTKRTYAASEAKRAAKAAAKEARAARLAAAAAAKDGVDSTLSAAVVDSDSDDEVDRANDLRVDSSDEDDDPAQAYAPNTQLDPLAEFNRALANQLAAAV